MQDADKDDKDKREKAEGENGKTAEPVEDDVYKEMNAKSKDTNGSASNEKGEIPKIP